MSLRCSLFRSGTETEDCVKERRIGFGPQGTVVVEQEHTSPVTDGEVGWRDRRRYDGIVKELV